MVHWTKLSLDQVTVKYDFKSMQMLTYITVFDWYIQLRKRYQLKQCNIQQFLG